MNFAQEIKGNSLILRITGDLIGEDNNYAIDFAQ
jgi:hypothetical protein